MWFFRTFTILAALLLLSTAPVNDVASQTAPHQVELVSGGKLWIEGSSTVSSWTCEADDLDGEALIQGLGDSERDNRSPDAVVEPRVRLSARVESFECGRARMDRDFYEALKGAEHPEIVFDLVEAQVVRLPASADEWYRLVVRGNLSIAGTTRLVEAEVSGREVGAGRFQVRGSKPLTMTAFGVQPPVALLGLVKAHDAIEVHFDLVAEPSSFAVR